MPVRQSVALGLVAFLLAGCTVVVLLVGCRSARTSKEVDPHEQRLSPTSTATPSASGTVTGSAQTNPEDVAALRAEIQRLEQRLDQLEPPTPIRVEAPPIDVKVRAMLAPDHVREVLATGRELPYGLVAVSQTWQPPQYSPAWHSTSYDRFASVQTIAEAARHRFFVQTVFQGSLATADESLIGVDLADLHAQPCGKTHAYPCGFPDESLGSWEVYVLKAHVESVRQQGSLVVFKVQPQLEGLEIIWLDKSILVPALGEQQSVWAALATSAGEVWDVRQVR